MKSNKNGYYILILNYDTHLLSLKFFIPGKANDAMEVYQKIESTRAETKIDAVLVSVSSFDILRSAYPNYFSDIGEFIGLVRGYIDK
jgi:hypothetical protein